MWDRTTFVRATAHRGLHDAGQGRIENTWPAFEAALKAGFGIECDLQSTNDNVPVVFHDFTLDRLTDVSGRLADVTFDEIKSLTYSGHTETILSFTTLLNRVAGRTPVLAELKSDWTAPNINWLRTICELAQNYGGPLALMSFDPNVMTQVKQMAPDVARGLVSGIYRHPNRDPWSPDAVSPERATDLTNLIAIDTVQPDFIAYHVKDLDCPAVHNARHNLNLPIFAWTVRDGDDWQLCKTFADAAIFEGTSR